MSRAACARIDLSALRRNLELARSVANGANVIAVIKADAYGHGAVPCARALSAADCFAVVGLEEAVVLRDAGIDKPIMLLEGFFDPSELRAISALGLQIVIHEPGQLAVLESARLEKPVTAWLKIDSGMHRLGIDPAETAGFVSRLQACAAVDAVHLMTHLACADDRQDDYTDRQLETFAVATRGLDLPRSIANSAGLLGWPATRGDWVRPGIMLYGSSPFIGGDATADGLAPVMNLESELIAVRDLAAGEPVGYGCTWRAPADIRMGVIALGYGDGYPRHAPAGTPVLVDGRRTTLIGRVSMDMLTVLLDDVPGARPGSPVRLWGEGLCVDEIAVAAGTISYELLTGITPRVPRIHID